MVDEKVKEKAKTDVKETTAVDSGDGDKPQTPKVIEEANAAAERLEKATEEMRKENSRHEEIMARKVLAGETEAGSAPKKEKETDEEYVERFKRGEVDPFVDDGIK